jgi:stalled ribosome alternative rescue factor ArfA
MTRRIKNRRQQAVKRRNPIARTLRAAAFRARKEQNRRHYSRKAKHQPNPETERE